MEQFTQRLKHSLPNSVKPVIPSGGPVILSGTDPITFWGGFLGALESAESIILMDPSWPPSLRETLLSKILPLPDLGGPRILIPTSGTTGHPKFCIHSSDTLNCAANAFAKRFGARGITHCVNVLPQHHVGGLLPVLRSAASGGRVHFADYMNISSMEAARVPLSQACISLVPTQLHRMLDNPFLRIVLKEFGLILIGGAACPLSLLRSAREENLHLAPCYGSTETAAMVTVMDPEDFINERKGVGTPLPHARIELNSEGRICITADSNLLGYLPFEPGFSRTPLISNDLGNLDRHQHLHILGRADRVIITGGEKVIPEQIESTALLTDLVSAAYCVGVPDLDWGMRVELTVVPAKPYPHLEQLLLDTLKKILPPYAIPKTIHLTDEIPVNSLGKRTHLDE